MSEATGSRQLVQRGPVATTRRNVRTLFTSVTACGKAMTPAKLSQSTGIYQDEAHGSSSLINTCLRNTEVSSLLIPVHFRYIYVELRVFLLSRYLFQPHGCHLPPLDAHKAAACLSNKRLILIGDSLAWSQFESLACLLGPIAHSTNSSRLFDVKHFHKFEDSKYRGDLLLPDNASVHMRGMNRFDRERWPAWVNALGGMHKNDILLVNFGAHYTLGSLEDYKTEMQQVILGELRRLPCTVYWREYAPAHFGGPSGKFMHDYNLKTCAPAEVGETEYDRVAKRILVECGAACSHMRWLPIFGPSLARHGSHTGDHIPDKARGFWVRALHHDCRHFCLNVVDLWNQILFASMCSPASAQA